MIVQDSFGSLMPGQYDGAPVMMFGCHWNQMDGGSLTSPAKFDHHNKVGRDYSWKRSLLIVKVSQAQFLLVHC